MKTKAKPARIDFLVAKQQSLRCVCGHPRSAHRSCSHKYYELGSCTRKLEVVIVQLDGTEEHLDCGCREYQPKETE